MTPTGFVGGFSLELNLPQPFAIIGARSSMRT
jgi:hypothetical protein